MKITIAKTISGIAAAGLVVGAVALAPHAHADVFEMCPNGHEGVVGGHTTCDFADNVALGFYACGMCHHFSAYSPVTGESYWIDCEGLYPAHFTDGEVLKSTRCYTVDSDAEVVVW